MYHNIIGDIGNKFVLVKILLRQWFLILRVSNYFQDYGLFSLAGRLKCSTINSLKNNEHTYIRRYIYKIKMKYFTALLYLYNFHNCHKKVCVSCEINCNFHFLYTTKTQIVNDFKRVSDKNVHITTTSEDFSLQKFPLGNLNNFVKQKQKREQQIIWSKATYTSKADTKFLF